MFTETAHPLLTFSLQRKETVEVSFLPNRDDMREMLIYAHTSQWEYATGIFNTILGLLMDVRH